MFFRVRENLCRRIFSFVCREIGQTPPIRMRPANLVIVTMLSHHDVFMYLVAIKSLYSQFGEGSVAVLDDGTLTAQDVACLNQHIPGIQILPIRAVETGPCPKGGCWERLVSVLGLTRSSYVMQMDSDTLTVNDISESVACYRENRSFLIGGSDGQHIVNVEENRAAIQHSTSTHLQVHAERQLPRLSPALGRKYVRGGAAFAGFARGCFSVQSLQTFSTEMQSVTGSRWNEWGSEQVASNFMIANSPGAFVLPFPKYASFWPSAEYQKSSFLHFLGTNRFKGGVYWRLAHKVVRELREAG